MLRFRDYDLIIDARSEREYSEDHIPGAINLPVVHNDEYAEVGTLHRTDKMRAYLIGVSYSLKNISVHLDTVIAMRPRRSRILVYCFRGGKRSRLWFDALDTIGYKVERLAGGWKEYRRWVNEQLLAIPREFTYNVLLGPTGCGKTRLLGQLASVGAQVLDLEALAAHRGSVIGAIPNTSQPTQKYFDSLLLRQLSAFTPDRPIWVEAESKKIGNVQLPTALLETMQLKGQLIRVSAPMAERVLLWREDYAHFESDPMTLVERLTQLRSLVGGKDVSFFRKNLRRGFKQQSSARRHDAALSCIGRIGKLLGVFGGHGRAVDANASLTDASPSVNHERWREAPRAPGQRKMPLVRQYLYF